MSQPTKAPKKRTPAKGAHRQTLVEYLSNPDNPWLTRAEYHTVVGITHQGLRAQLSPTDLAEIEADALQIRRSRMATVSGRVDKALIEKCETGDPAAIKLYYQRIEAWHERQTIELAGKNGGPMEIIVEVDRDR